MKERALQRDLAKEKEKLKERSIAMVEEQVETLRKQLRDWEKQTKLNKKAADLQGRLAEQRVDYDCKLRVLDEIKRDKAKHERHMELVKE